MFLQDLNGLVIFIIMIEGCNGHMWTGHGTQFGMVRNSENFFLLASGLASSAVCLVSGRNENK